jgi:hypothetical protein
LWAALQRWRRFAHQRNALPDADPVLPVPVETTAVDRPQAPVLTFNNPPGWPDRPAGWSPPSGWEPDPSWPQASYGWPLWVPPQVGRPEAADDLMGHELDAEHNAIGGPDADLPPIGVDNGTAPESPGRARRRWWLLPTLAVSLLLIAIGTGAWLLTSATGGGHKIAVSSTPYPPATHSQSLAAKPTATPSKSSAPVDWRNHAYTLVGQSCLANVAKTVTVANGAGTADNLTVTVFKTISGDFSGNGTQEVAVLLGCNGGGSGSGSEIQVLTNDGTLLQRLLPPGETASGASSAPQFDPYAISATRAGDASGSAFTTGVHIWAAGDAHCCPSQDVVYRWSWNGKAFVSSLDHVVAPTVAPTTAPAAQPVPVLVPVTLSCDNVSFTPGQASDSGAFLILATNTDCATAQALAVDGGTGPVSINGYGFDCNSADGTTPGLAYTVHSCRDPYGRVVTWHAT